MPIITPLCYDADVPVELVVVVLLITLLGGMVAATQHTTEVSSSCSLMCGIVISFVHISSLPVHLTDPLVMILMIALTVIIVVMPLAILSDNVPLPCHYHLVPHLSDLSLLVL